MVIGSIPPPFFVKGNNPKHAINYLTALEDTFVGLVTTLLDEEESHRIDNDSFRAGFLQAASTKR